MIDSLRAPDTKIATIVDSLVAKFRPHCIYLFGSRARGDHRSDSDYDIFMEVAPENWPEDEYHTQNGVLIGFRDAQVHVRIPGTLESYKDEPGWIMYDVAREGVLLFSAPGYKSPQVSDLPLARIRERPARSARVEEWLRLARLDLALVEHLAWDIDNWKEPISFHAQQSAEKYLKALIAARTRRGRHIHDLNDLLEFARDLNYHLGGIDRRCRRLTRYVIDGRYRFEDMPTVPSDRRISREDALRALEDVRAVSAAVERELP